MGGRGGSSGIGKTKIEVRTISPVRNIPDLNGTEKQVQWAQTIRKDILNEVRAGFSYAPDGRKTTYIKDLFDEKSVKKITDNLKEMSKDKSLTHIVDGNLRTIKHLSESFERYRKLTEENSAKFWIDNRKDIDGIYKRVFGVTKTELLKRWSAWATRK